MIVTRNSPINIILKYLSTANSVRWRDIWFSASVVPTALCNSGYSDYGLWNRSNTMFAIARAAKCILYRIEGIAWHSARSRVLYRGNEEVKLTSSCLGGMVCSWIGPEFEDVKLSITGGLHLLHKHTPSVAAFHISFLVFARVFIYSSIGFLQQGILSLLFTLVPHWRLCW